MSKSSWVPLSDRKWDPSKVETDFIKLVENAGYMIVGIQEFSGQTNYKIGKDGIWQDFTIYHTNNVKAEELYDTFVRFFDIRVQYEQLKAQYDQQGNL